MDLLFRCYAFRHAPWVELNRVILVALLRPNLSVRQWQPVGRQVQNGSHTTYGKLTDAEFVRDGAVRTLWIASKTLGDVGGNENVNVGFHGSRGNY